MPKSRPAFTLSLSLLILLFANLISPSPSFSQTETEEETITISTYYPAPFGVYNEMRAKKMAVGDNYYDGSQYCWPPAVCSNQIDGFSSFCSDCNTDLVVEGNVGIGTTNPSAGGEQDLKLDVDGAVGAKFYCDQDGNNCSSAPLGGGSWVDITSDTGNFDTQCEYKWIRTDGGGAFYPTHANINSITMDYSAGNYQAVNKANKGITSGDTGTFNVSTYKRCS